MNGFDNSWHVNINCTKFISELIALLAHLIDWLKTYKPIVYLTITASQEVIETIRNLNGFHNSWHVNVNCTEFHFLTRCITCVLNLSIKNVQTHGLPDDGCISGSNRNHSKFEWFPQSLICKCQLYRVSFFNSLHYLCV